MATSARPVRCWACRVGRHRYQQVNDDNPENRKGTHLLCVHCGRTKEIKSYEPGTSPSGIGPWVA